MIDNMKAGLIHRFKNITPEGDIIEAAIWKLPNPVKPSEHLYKYRMVYVVNGKRVGNIPATRKINLGGQVRYKYDYGLRLEIDPSVFKDGENLVTFDNTKNGKDGDEVLVLSQYLVETLHRKGPPEDSTYPRFVKKHRSPLSVGQKNS